MFQLVPFEKATDGPPKVHEHLSAFSAPLESYQASRRGSLRASESSWPDTLARAASPCDWELMVDCGSHPGSPSRLVQYLLPPTPVYQKSSLVILSEPKFEFDQLDPQKIAAVWAVTIIFPPCQIRSGLPPA